MPEQIANQALTTLAAELAKGATTLTVASAARFPSEGQFRILIDSELLMVTAIEGTTFTVERGIEETTDVVHVSGSTVTQILTAAGFATKADLEEGVLLESEIPSSVATGSVADKSAGRIMYVRSDGTTTGWVEPPTVDAAAWGVSSENADNSEALSEAISAMETISGKLRLPSGELAFSEGFLLNREDDENGSFQYVIEGDGRGTILAPTKTVDWVFRVNVDAEDNPVHSVGNLVGRIQLRDVYVKGTVEGEEASGLIRIAKASAQLKNVRCLEMDYGVYQADGYCDHHSFEDVRWKSLTTPNGWCLYINKTNGDGHNFRRCSFGPSKAAHFHATAGATIDDCIGGLWEMHACTGIEFRGHHLDPAVLGEEISAPMIRIEDSRVRIAGGFLLAAESQPIIEVNDNDVYDATQLIVDGTSFGWRNGDPEVSPPRAAHIHIAAVWKRARFIFHYPRGFCVNEGSTVSDPVGVLVTSDDEDVQAAIDAAPEQVNGHAVLTVEDNTDWKLRPVSRVRTATRWENAPAITAIGAQLEIGGEIAKETKYFYRMATWDGFQWSERSSEESGETEADETAFMLWVNTRGVNVKVRVWRGSTEGEYDRYVDLTIPTLLTRLCDVGDYLAGLAWVVPEKEEEVPATPESTEQRDLVEVSGHRLLWDSEAPSNGEWSRGDRVLHTEPSAGGNEGWICVESGEPGTWKKFGTIAE